MTHTCNAQEHSWLGGCDPLDALEAQGRAERAVRSAARKTPEAKAKKQRGRIQKRRGYAAEKQVEAVLAPYGFKRVPLSGALGGELRGDVRRAAAGKACEVGEVKRRQGCDKGMRDQLAQGAADFLVRVPGNGGEPLVVLTLTRFAQLLGEGGYGQ